MLSIRIAVLSIKLLQHISSPFSAISSEDRFSKTSFGLTHAAAHFFDELFHFMPIKTFTSESPWTISRKPTRQLADSSLPC
jgi:hypothetical protein